MGNNIVLGKNEKLPKAALPEVAELSEPLLNEITAAFGLSRDVIADEESIEYAWQQLPRQLSKIPIDLRDERLVRMCVAVASGLFDAAINYVWNATIVELREKVRRFGLGVIPQLLDDASFDEGRLVGLKDAELLDLCRKLNLLGEDDFFFLNQCRDTRNNFSVAHPAAGIVDEDEFISFLSRCRKHGLVQSKDPQGVDTKAFLAAVKESSFKTDQREEWERRLHDTFDAQRELLFGTLHGIFCDPSAEEHARQNARAICATFSESLSPKAASSLIDRHQDYKAKGDEARQQASTQFFEQIGRLDLLGDAEVHSIITKACSALMRVHQAFDNFYNEPPFASRLREISDSVAIPSTAQATYVETVVTCAAGNPYGVSRAALVDYKAMIKNFSPAEIAVMMKLPQSTTVVGNRFKTDADCKKRFRARVALLQEESVPTSVKATYQKLLPK